MTNIQVTLAVYSRPFVRLLGWRDGLSQLTGLGLWWALHLLFA